VGGERSEKNHLKNDSCCLFAHGLPLNPAACTGKKIRDPTQQKLIIRG